MVVGSAAVLLVAVAAAVVGASQLTMSVFRNIAGAKVAIVGCGTYAVGKRLGKAIDSCDIVIRANRAYNTEFIHQDYGSRTDHLVIGNISAMIREIPTGSPFKVHAIGGQWWKKMDKHAKAWDSFKRQRGNRWSEFPEEDFAAAWTNPQRPLAGTCAAVMAAYYGAAEMLIVGLDMYRDTVRPNGLVIHNYIFPGHANRPPPGGRFDLSVDEQALLNLPCPKVTWIRPPSIVGQKK